MGEGTVRLKRLKDCSSLLISSIVWSVCAESYHLFELVVRCAQSLTTSLSSLFGAALQLVGCEKVEMGGKDHPNAYLSILVFLIGAMFMRSPT